LRTSSDLPPSMRLNQDMRCAAVKEGERRRRDKRTARYAQKLIPRRRGYNGESRPSVPLATLAEQACIQGVRMTPRKKTVEKSKGVFEVEWPLFGELSRALALKVVRNYDPEIIVGIATAGVVPGAVIAAILDREFLSIMVSRRYQSDVPRDLPAIFGGTHASVRGKRVLVVDETCDSGATMRLAVSSIVEAGAREVKTAVAFRTGSFEPDYHALATESTIVLPWDREVLFQGELVPNPLYRQSIGE
jgi:hypoxanthine phosphoribosyltransferase